jgi:hypothetical protein
MSVIESKDKSLKVKIPFTELPKYVPEIPIKKCDKIIKCKLLQIEPTRRGGENDCYDYL